MERTPRLDLPYIMAAQAQKHVTHNEAVRSLDALVQISVKSRVLANPPQEPDNGEGYLVAAAASDDWLSKDGELAVYQDGAWAFFEPLQGWLIWVEDEAELLVFTATGFEKLSELVSTVPTVLQDLQLLGVQSTADNQNPLTVQGNGSLFSHDGTDHRLSINKSTVSDTASMVFQTNWSGRAEFGLAGTDDFTIKVSDDGSAFHTAMSVEKSSGRISFPNTNVSVGNAINLFQDAGRMSDSNFDLLAGTFAFPNYFELYNGGTVSGSGKFIQNNTDYGGNAGALDNGVRLLVDKIKHPNSRRYGLEFWVGECTAGSGSGAPYSVSGSTYYKSAYSRLGPSLSTLTFHVYVRAVDNPIVVRQRATEMHFHKDGVVVSGDVEISPAEDWVAVLLNWQVDTYSHLGYAPPYLDLYCLNAGDRWQMACPALVPGLTEISPSQGVLASYNMWSAN